VAIHLSADPDLIVVEFSISGYTFSHVSYFGQAHPRYTVLGPVRAAVRLTMALLVLAVQLGWIILAGAVRPGRIRTIVLTSLTRITGRTFLWFLRFKLRIRGPIPPAGSLIVGNHISWIDGFAFAGALGCRFVAIHWIHEIPLVRSALRTLSIETIHKTALRDLPRLNRAIRLVQEEDRSMMFFPEATTLRGDQVYEFRAALLDNAARDGNPVHWAAISFSIPVRWVPVGLVVPWPDWTPLMVHAFRVGHIPRTVCTIRFGREAVTGTDRRTLAGELQRRVSDAFTPLEQASPEETLRYYRKQKKS